jgi:PTS system nitrogen regulatory IIA component
MNSFSQFLFPENIVLGLQASSKAQALPHIAEVLERHHQISRTLIYESLCKREQLGSTALGEGVAIPHAQIKGLRHPMTAFIRLSSAIEFDAPDEKPVSEIFVLLVPLNVTLDHLQMLANVAEMLCDERFREQLNAAIDPVNIQRLFSEFSASA